MHWFTVHRCTDAFHALVHFQLLFETHMHEGHECTHDHRRVALACRAGGADKCSRVPTDKREHADRPPRARVSTGTAKAQCTGMPLMVPAAHALNNPPGPCRELLYTRSRWGFFNDFWGRRSHFQEFLFHFLSF